MAHEKLKVIALISGGKDSVFSILHCLANGHAVVALANLHPDTNAKDEDIDSQMYQTVGHSIVPLFEQALGLPLYRLAIHGSAVNTAKEYAPPPLNSNSDQDEAESMLTLLENVKKQHPEANAVCTGAILSDYQRTRVESVAIRLELTSLSYLWQYPFLPPYSSTSLLEDMFAVGQDARLIKVASLGLDERFLGQNVANPAVFQKMQVAMSRFEQKLRPGTLIGEGGEFETLAVNGPAPLWKKRIEVKYADPVGDGSVAYARVSKASIVDKSEQSLNPSLAPRLPDAPDREIEATKLAMTQSSAET
ncbi:hypothetical protein LTS18_006851, partial [Coniosporium uncinatum]